MTNFVATLKQWLKSTHSICVLDDWLEACVEWIQEENQGANLQIETLKNQVFEQWLLSDLRELKAPSLPSNIFTNRKVEINGAFAVQIDSAIDVGCSFYSQTQKLKGTENANALVSGEEPKQPAWEPKPTRMIVLKLTDGVQDVKAMEYKPISALTPFLTPGTKMVIRGPVLCRLGMLMLGPSNVHILGGEVDSLMETNTPEAVLSVAMQEGQAENGKNERQEFSGHMITKGEDKMAMSVVHQPQGRSAVKQEVIKREPSTQTSQYTSMTRPNQGGVDRFQSSIKQETADPDWEDDFDYDALMADMEQEPPCSRGGNFNRHLKPEPVSQNLLPKASRLPNQSLEVKLQNDFDHEFDDDFDVESVEHPIKSEPQSPKSDNENADTDEISKTSQRGRDALYSSTRRIQTNHQKTMKSNATNCNFDTNQRKCDQRNSTAAIGQTATDFDDDFEMDDFDIEELQTQENNPKPPKMMKMEHGTDLSFSNDQSKKSLTTDRSFKSEDCHTVLKDSVPKAVIHPFSSNSENIQLSKNNHSHSASLSRTRTNFQEKSSSSSNLSNKQCSSFQGLNITGNVQGPVSTVQMSNTFGSAQKNKACQSRMDHFLCSGENVRRSPRQPSEPKSETFTYLSTVLRNLSATETKEVIIKGYISTLTRKLTSNQGKQWNLSCKVNDGTASLDVDLSNSILTKLIGFSAEDSVVMKQRARSDPSTKDVLTEGLQQCQQSLTDLSSLMKIRFQPGLAIPVVTEIIPITTRHVQYLYEKIMTFNVQDR